MVLVICEMQSVSSRIRTRVAVSISYDDNHYTTDTSSVTPRELFPPEQRVFFMVLYQDI